MPTCLEKPSTDAWAKIRRRDGGRGEAAADGLPSASVGQPQHRTGDSGSAADAICHERLKPPPLDRNVVIDGHQLACRREQLPLPGYALEHVGAPLLEGDARAVDEVLHGARHEDLACLRQCGNPGANVHGDATDVLTTDLTLSGADHIAHRYPNPASAPRPWSHTEGRASGRRTPREKPSPVCCMTRPWKRLISVWVTSSWRASSSRQPRSPSRAACRVESTMSVNNTVASSRSGKCSCRCPVRNSSTSPVIDLMSPTVGQ